jgi:hypothetical protein
MSTQTSTLRELDTRVNDGIEVRLLWAEGEDQLSVAVADSRSGESFSIQVPEGASAIDVFHHPYAYAAWRGAKTTAGLPQTDSDESLPLAA